MAGNLRPWSPWLTAQDETVVLKALRFFRDGQASEPTEHEYKVLNTLIGELRVIEQPGTKTLRRHIIDIDSEELEHLTSRRTAVKRFIDLCRIPYPADETRAERQDEMVARAEKELRTRWGVNV